MLADSAARRRSMAPHRTMSASVKRVTSKVRSSGADVAEVADRSGGGTGWPGSGLPIVVGLARHVDSRKGATIVPLAAYSFDGGQLGKSAPQFQSDRFQRIIIERLNHISEYALLEKVPPGLFGWHDTDYYDRGMRRLLLDRAHQRK